MPPGVEVGEGVALAVGVGLTIGVGVGVCVGSRRRRGRYCWGVACAAAMPAGTPAGAPATQTVGPARASRNKPTKASGQQLRSERIKRHGYRAGRRGETGSIADNSS